MRIARMGAGARTIATLALAAGAWTFAGQLASAQSGADAAAALVTADENFNGAVAGRDRARFLSFIADEATFMGGAEPLRGPEAIAEGWAPFFRKDGPTLEWHPTSAEVLVGGDVGYTVGRWVRRAPDASGKIVQTTRQYTTVWRKQPDGAWKVVFDIGSTAP